MPANSFDTFFACTIIVAVVLIATAFTGTTLHAQIMSTEGANKDSYLKAIADNILAKPGTPATWGTAIGLPSDFGLASANSAEPYELDVDKISRLNSQNAHSLEYSEILMAAKLNNIALGIEVSQVMLLNIEQISNQTLGSDTSITLSVSTLINSKPTSVNLYGYIIADSYHDEVNTTSTGERQLTVEVPTAKINGALLVLFARAILDDRITSYGVYGFQNAAQQTYPTTTTLQLSPLDYTLTLNDTAPGIQVTSVSVFSYSYNLTTISIVNSQCSIPRLIDNSPIVIVANGFYDGVFLQEWTTYPPVPLQAGSNFDDSERNVFSYLITVNGVLYRIELSLGDVTY